ncbi:MAG: hypothetical protein Tsb009_32970 [Planctomycetaceae bacterium]
MVVNCSLSLPTIAGIFAILSCQAHVANGVSQDQLFTKTFAKVKEKIKNPSGKFTVNPKPKVFPGQQKTSHNPSDALSAAWESVRKRIPIKMSEQIVKVNSNSLHRFAGFIEGILRLSPPKWWESMLLNAEAHHRNNIFFSPPHKIHSYAR